MKRWLTAALAFIMILSPMQISVSAEGVEEVVSAPVEEAAQAAEDSGAEGLTIAIGDDAADEAGDEEPLAEDAGDQPADEAGPRYGATVAATAVCTGRDADTAFIRVEAGATLLMLGEADGWIKVAFCTERGIATGYAAGGDIAPLDADAVNAFMDAMAASGSCALYNDDANLPLDTPACTFIETEENKETEETEETENTDTEETETTENTETVEDTETTETTENTETDETAEDTEDTGDGEEAEEAVVNEGAIDAEPKAAVAPEKIALNASTGKISVGEVYKGLQVVMTPANATSEITWSTSKEKYVTVDPAKGWIKGMKKGGYAYITATATNGKSATCKVTVVAAPSKAYITLSANKLSIGDTAQATASVDSKSVCSTYKFSTSNAKVATVDENGLITAVGKGTATITAATHNNKTASAQITVYDLPSRVEFPEASLTLGVGQKIMLDAGAVARDGSATYSAVSYALTSARPAGCVTVTSAGELKAVAVGDAVVRGSANNGAYGDCTITVVPAPKSVKLNVREMSMGLKETYRGLTATLTMSDGSVVENGKVTWTSGSPKVATVDENTGAIYGLKTGSANITASTYNGCTATCKVTVCKAPSKFTLNPASVKLSAGGMTAQLDVTFPKKTASGAMRFDTSDAKVATVDENGLVTSVGEGTATILAQAFNGVRAYCSVRVYGQPGRVTLDRTEMTLGAGQTATLTATAATASGGETLSTLTYYVDPSSANPNCVRVNAETGEVTAVSIGTALVGAKAHNGVAAQKACLVTVVPAPVSVTLPGSYTIGVGETADPIPAIVRYSDGSESEGTDLTWSTSKSKYVAVEANTGRLKGVKKGSATITVRTYNGKSASCVVTVAKGPKSIAMSPTTLKLAAGGMHFTLQTTLSPSNTASDITFTSSNPAAATVDDRGVITTVGKGTAVITARTFNKLEAKCTLTVTDLPATAKFTEDSVTLLPNQKVTPTVSVKAKDGSEAMADLEFSVDSGAAYIKLDSATGEITAVKTGVAVVSAKTHNGVSCSNRYTVTVQTGSSSIELSNSGKLTMGVGESTTLTVKSGSGITWSSSNTKAAVVSQSGEVVAVGTGKATITATNGIKSASCQVEVKKAPTSVSISPASGTLNVGGTGQYTVKLSSNSAGSYTFSSSNPAVATVDQEGHVIAASAGTTVITVTTYNGHTADAKLTVKGGGTIVVPEEIEKYGVASYQNTYNASMSNAQKLEYVIYVGQGQLGKPYVYGGGYNQENPSGFDCSGFVYWCFKHIGIKLGNSAYKQGYDSTYTKITNASDLKRGDVVCFNTVSDDDLSDHTGIYLGNGYFIHASSGSSKMRVIVQRFTKDSISGDYYSRNFSWGRRILK